MSTVTKCMACGLETEELREDDHGCSLCEDCMKDTKHCDDCDCIFDKTEIVIAGGRSVCEECSENNYFCCASCSESFSHDDSCPTEDGYVCDDCRDRHYTNCDSCGSAVRESIEINSGTYCNSCSDDMCVCSNCGSACEELVSTDEDDAVCPDCARTAVRVTLPPECDGGYLGTRCFGIELEFDEVYNNNSDWDRVYDGSLSCGNGEFLSGPLRGVNGIDDVSRNVPRIKGKINNHCGFHLHIDMTQNTMQEARNVVMTAIGMEKYIFGLVSKSRRKNRYCMSLHNRLVDLTNSPLDEWTYYPGYSQTLTGDKYHDKRYEWINSHSYFFRGTLEIRLHQGTGNCDKVLRWTELWLKIADWAVKQEPNFIRMHCTTPEFTDMVLNSIGLRPDTIEYLNKRIAELSESEDSESDG